MISRTDARWILSLAADADIKIFLDGGWGVDALLGYAFDENDIHDVKMLCETFHIEIPKEYKMYIKCNGGKYEENRCN